MPRRRRKLVVSSIGRTCLWRPRAFGTYGLRFPIGQHPLRPWFFDEYLARLLGSCSFLTRLRIVGCLSGKVRSFTSDCGNFRAVRGTCAPRVREAAHFYRITLEERFVA